MRSKVNIRLALFMAFLFTGKVLGILQAQDVETSLNSSGHQRRQYFTHKIDVGAIKLDGLINEAAWKSVDWSEDFIQYQPKEGDPPYQQTQFKIVHDDKYLYFASRAFDHEPDSIKARLSRRDEFPGDWIEVNIDSYHDLRTAFSFTLSVSGVKGDEFISENGNHWDESWNPIWDVVTHIDSAGWTAEARIPFSQLRYGNQDHPIWGIQVQRRIFRKEERST
ncbi:MAG TPA: carbohydrate binding family 9 domain-containing protein, partial [Saprospiraceae bacterium]|nr:carbohydrate binding family 9 domain-containing protein [Saprospiraceae bacterium]